MSLLTPQRVQASLWIGLGLLVLVLFLVLAVAGVMTSSTSSY
jgi:hypothetical protein